jgi:hypothetical protein
MNQALENRSGVLANKIDTHISESEFGDLDAAAIAISASQHIANLAAAMRPNLINAGDWDTRYTDADRDGLAASATAKFWGIEYTVGVKIDQDGSLGKGINDTTVTVNFIRIDAKNYRVDYRKPCTTTAEVAMAAVTLLGLIYSEGDA